MLSLEEKAASVEGGLSDWKASSRTIAAVLTEWVAGMFSSRVACGRRDEA